MEEEWRLFAEGEPAPSCSSGDFFSALEVWISRPQVVNRRLMAAVLQKDSQQWQERESKVWETLSNGCDVAGLKKRVLLRELLPKYTRTPPGRELVITGEAGIT